MWKKAISLFLTICMLTAMVGCGSSGGANIVTPGQNDENILVENENYNVSQDEGGVFEFTDGAKVEIGENTLSKNATLTISKLTLSTAKDSSNDFEIVSGLYDIKFTEQDVQILKPIKISLPIPSNVDPSAIAIVHFHEDGQYDILNGTISSDGKLISIEVTELSPFAIINFLTSGDIETLPFIDNIMDLYIDVIVAASNYDYDTLQAMTILWEYKLNEAEEAMSVSAGISVEDVAKLGVMIFASIGTGIISEAFITYLMKAKVCKALLIAMKYGEKLTGYFENILDVLDTNWDDVAVEVTEYYTAYIIYNSYLKAYQTIGLEGWADVAPIEGPAPLKVHLNGVVSGGIEPYTYQWNFGDGNLSGEIPDNESFWIYHTYEEPGKYTPILYAEDSEGKTGYFVAGEITVTKNEIAKINIAIKPNPVPCSSETNSWPFNIILDESNGVGVTLSGLIFEEYNQQGQKIYTGFHDEEGIADWFGTNYIPAFSSIQFLETHGYMIDPGVGFAEYVKVIVQGIDDNGNQIEETAEIDLLPQ